MIDHEHLNELINHAVNNIEYPEQPARLYAPISYTLASGGKRVRPTLLLMAAASLGLDPALAINQAIGIEMFHNFTLLHDDVMDNADIRRGLPTVHRRWSTNTAILSGDAMLTMASIYMSRCEPRHMKAVLTLFNRTAMEVYEGQQYDMDYENRRDVSTQEYLKMIRLKTSVLIGCACRMGAILADADEATCKSFYDFGVNLGLGFQLRDDILDTYGDPILFGKQIGGDIINEKKTWLLTSAIELDNTGELLEILSTVSEPGSKIERVRAIYDRLGLKQMCENLVDTYSSSAIESLNHIKMTDEYRQYFTDLTHDMTRRNV